MRPAKVFVLKSASGWLSRGAFHTNRDPTMTVFSLLKLRIPALKKLFKKSVCDLWCLIYEKACIQLKSNLVMHLFSCLYKKEYEYVTLETHHEPQF